MKIIKRLPAILVAVAVGFSPLAPVLSASTTTDPSHAAHGGAGAADATALHADHEKDRSAAGADDQPTAGCAQHDQCNGKCCVTCVQCFTAAFNFSAASAKGHSIQFPTVLRLADRLTVAVHNRPPTV